MSDQSRPVKLGYAAPPVFWSGSYTSNWGGAAAAVCGIVLVATILWGWWSIWEPGQPRFVSLYAIGVAATFSLLMLALLTAGMYAGVTRRTVGSEVNEDGIRYDRWFWPWSDIVLVGGQYTQPPDLIKSLRAQYEKRRVQIAFSASSGALRSVILLSDDPLDEASYRALMHRLEEFLSPHYPSVTVRHDPLEPSSS